MNWTHEKPKGPGWYWCRNRGDHERQIWEAVVRLDVTPDGLICSWMTAPGKADTMHESNFSPECQWAGPIQHPESNQRIAYISVEFIKKQRP